MKTWVRGGTAEIRRWFLLMIREAAPQVLEDLRSLVDAEELTQIRRWATRWNLRAPWLVEYAANAAAYVSAHPEITLKKIWGATTIGPLEALPTVSDFMLTWEPGLPETISAPGLGRYSQHRFGCRVGGPRAYARKVFHDAMEKYLDDVERIYSEAGFSSPEIRNRGGIQEYDRLRWVVLRRCLGLSWQEIAERESETSGDPRLTRSAIRTAVKSRAQALGFDSEV